MRRRANLNEGARRGYISHHDHEVEFSISCTCGLARSPASRMAHLKEVLKACKVALGGSSQAGARGWL